MCFAINIFASLCKCIWQGMIMWLIWLIPYVADQILQASTIIVLQSHIIQPHNTFIQSAAHRFSVQTTCHLNQILAHSRVWYFSFQTSLFRNFSIFGWFWIRYRNFCIGKSIGFGIVKIWHRKKCRIRYRKNLVSEEDSDSVLFRFRVFWVTFRFQNFSSSQSQTFPFLDSFGFGIEKS